MGIILNAVIGTVIVTLLGGGIAYFLWLKTRPKKETWIARVWRLGEGIRQPLIDKKGNMLSELKLHELLMRFDLV